MIRRLSTVVIAVFVVTILPPAAALAHVEILTAQPNGDETTTLTFAFDHSCTGSTTTELTVALPAEATPSAATAPAGWKTAIVANRVTWTGPGIEKGTDFGVVTRIVARPGQALLFPTVQRCADGNQYTWTGTRFDDEHPAPRLVATTAILASTPPSAPLTSAPGSGGGHGLGATIAALVGFVILAAAAGFQLARRPGEDG